MRMIFQILSCLALVGTILPSIIFCAGGISMDSLDFVKWIMLLSTVVWFVFTPLWMGREEK